MMILLGVLLIVSPLLVAIVYYGVTEGWGQYWQGGDEGPW